MIFVVRREVNVLTKTERREKRQKLRGESVCRIIEMNVKVTGDDKFMGCRCSGGEKRTEVTEEDREWHLNLQRLSKMCLILGMLQFIQVLIIRLFVNKNSQQLQ